MKRLLWISIIILIAGCAIGSTPESAYKKVSEYANNKDWGAVYDSVDAYSRGQLDTSLKMLASFASAFSDDETKPQISELSGRDLFIRMANSNMSEDATSFAPKTDYKIIKSQRNNKNAALIVQRSDGSVEEVNMVLEEGKWKIQLANKDGEPKSSSKKKKLSLAEKAEKAKQEKLAKEAQEKEKALKEEMRRVLTVAIFDKSFMEADVMNGRYNGYISIKLVLNNNGDKDIKAVKGSLNFKDVFGDEIYSASFKYDESIKAKSKKEWLGGIEYNQFNDGMKKLRSVELKNLTLDWQPQAILFEDGSKLGE